MLITFRQGGLWSLRTPAIPTPKHTQGSGNCPRGLGAEGHWVTAQCGNLIWALEPPPCTRKSHSLHQCHSGPKPPFSSTSIGKFWCFLQGRVQGPLLLGPFPTPLIWLATLALLSDWSRCMTIQWIPIPLLPPQLNLQLLDGRNWNMSMCMSASPDNAQQTVNEKAGGVTEPLWRVRHHDTVVVIWYWRLPKAFRGWNYKPHFSNKEIEAQKGQVTFSKLQK